VLFLFLGAGILAVLPYFVKCLLTGIRIVLNSGLDEATIRMAFEASSEFWLNA
jgi:hypothetical protein